MRMRGTGVSRPRRAAVCWAGANTVCICAAVVSNCWAFVVLTMLEFSVEWYMVCWSTSAGTTHCERIKLNENILGFLDYIDNHHKIRLF